MNTPLTCPNCGATTKHIENVPNRFTCSYCDTVFEHTSYVPVRQSARFSYDYLRELLEKCKELDRTHKDYLTDSFALLVQVPELIQNIQDQELIQESVDYMINELDWMKMNGYHHVGVYDPTSSDCSHMHLYVLSQYHIALAKSYSASHYKESNIDNAIAQCDIALALQKKYLGGEERATKRLKEELLQARDNQ